MVLKLKRIMSLILKLGLRDPKNVSNLLQHKFYTLIEAMSYYGINGNQDNIEVYEGGYKNTNGKYFNLKICIL